MLKDNILTNSCTPEWVAQTYAQYLESKADDYTTLLSAVSNAISVDIEDEMQSIESEYDEVIAQLKERVNYLAEVEGIVTKDLSPDSDELEYFITYSVKRDDVINQLINDNFLQTDKVKYNLSSLLIGYSDTYSGDENTDGVVGAGLFQFFAPYRELCDAKAQEIISMYNLNDDMPISLNHGYTNALELFSSVISNSNSNDSEYSQLQLQLTDINGNALFDSYAALKDHNGYSLASLFDEVKNNYSSIVSYAAGFTASTFESVSDRLTYFSSYVGDRINNLGSDAVNISRVIKSKLSDVSVTASQFFDSFINMMGWDKLTSTGNGLPNIIDKSLMYQYTGASPAGPLDFSQAASTGERVIKTIGVSLASIGIGLWNLAKTAFSKASTFINEVVVNPFDIETLDNGSKTSLVDGFQYQTDEQSGSIDLKTKERKDQFLKKLNDSYLNQWIGCKGIFGETLFRPYYVGSIDDTSISMSYQALFKPKCINFNALKRCSQLAESVIGVAPHFVTNTSEGGVDFNIFSLDLSSNSYNTDKTFKYWELFLYNLSHSNDLYVEKSDSFDERDFEIGYILATKMQQYVNFIATNALSYYYPKDQYASSLFTPYVEDYGWMSGFNYDKSVASTTSNLNLVKATCGYNPEPSFQDWYAFSLIPMERIGHNNRTNSIDDYFNTWNLSEIIIQAWFDKVVDPLDYMYIPYSNNKSNFSAPQYRIKTDADNWEAFNSFMTKAIIVVIAITVAISAAVIVTKLMRKMYFKRAGEVAKMDSAMWNGTKLTSSEQRKYVRFSRKLNKSNLLTRGLVGTATSETVNTVDVIGGKLATMYTQLSGTAASPENDIIETSLSKDSDKSLLTKIIDKIGE